MSSLLLEELGHQKEDRGYLTKKPEEKEIIHYILAYITKQPIYGPTSFHKYTILPRKWDRIFVENENFVVMSRAQRRSLIPSIDNTSLSYHDLQQQETVSSTIKERKSERELE